MPTVTFVKEKKTIEVPPGANLRNEARKAGIEIYPPLHRSPLAHCPGLGLCTTCAVHIKKGRENVKPPGLWEKLSVTNPVLHPITFLAHMRNKDEFRLACRTRVFGDIEVETQPDLNLHGEKFWG